MPKVYDPRNHAVGKKMIRSRRRRKSPNSSAVGQSATRQNNALIGDDLLEFCSSIENSTPTPTKQRWENGSMTPAPVEPPSTTETTCPPSTTSVGTGMQGARNALAIDTRFLDAQGDKTTAYTLIENCHDLVQNAVDRGIAPHIVSWTKLQETKDVKKTARPRAQVVEVHSMCCEADKKLEFAPVLIQPSSANSSSNQSQSVFQVPKLLAASATWKLFSDFVESIILAAFPQNGTTLDSVTLLTNDVSFLSDTRAKAHKAGLDQFWNSVKRHFLESKMQSIRIVVLLTDAIEIVGDDQNVPLEDTRSRGLAIAECINAINQHIRKKVEAEFRANRSYVQFDSSKHLPTINISLSTVDNSSLGLKTLLRKWSRERVGGPCRLTFDLPETMDSSHCSLALDAAYKSIPFRLDSQPARALRQDLEFLSQATLNVEKLVSITSLDASLLYGVPLRVRPGLESDIQSHKEMILLVQSLFHQLSRRNCALFITSQGPHCSHEEALFHSNDQTFVLMAEEIPLLLRETAAPSTGLLFRVACANQLLAESGPGDFIASSRKNDSSNPFFDYVEQALDCLAYLDTTTGYNPLYAGAIKTRPRPPRDEKTAVSVENKTGIWNDTSGVGASKAAVDTENALLVGSTATPAVTEVADGTIGASKTLCKSARNANSATSAAPKPRKESYNSELDDEDYLHSPLNQRTVLGHRSGKNLALKTRSVPKDAESENDEVEWTDDEQLGFAPIMDDSSSDSDNTNAEKETVASFDYSQG